MVEPEYATATEIKKSHVEIVPHYLPIFQQGDDNWLVGMMYRSEEDLIAQYKYNDKITRLKIFRVDLPIQNFREDVELN